MPSGMPGVEKPHRAQPTKKYSGVRVTHGRSCACWLAIAVVKRSFFDSHSAKGCDYRQRMKRLVSLALCQKAMGLALPKPDGEGILRTGVALYCTGTPVQLSAARPESLQR